MNYFMEAGIENISIIMYNISIIIRIGLSQLENYNMKSLFLFLMTETLSSAE